MKLFKVILNSVALVSLISCGQVDQTFSDSNKGETSSTLSSSITSIHSSESSKESQTSSSSKESSSSLVGSSSAAGSNIGESSSIHSSESSKESQTSSSSKESSSSLVGSSSAAGSNIGESSSTPKETYYHVIFLNFDESVLYETNVKEGDEAIYVGETPERPEQDGFTFTFKGWDKDLTSISSDLVTIAEYVSSDADWSPIHWF